MKIVMCEHPAGNSMGGKGAGLVTLDRLRLEGKFKDILERMGSESRFRRASELVVPVVPDARVLCEGHFRSYISQPAVREAIESGDFQRIRQSIESTRISDEITLRAIYEVVRELRDPVAARSSASCEDASRNSPFAGDFTTLFVANNQNASEEIRAMELERAVRSVYLSFFNPHVREKMLSLGLDPSEHFMGVVLQRVIGDRMEVRTVNGVADVYMPLASAVLASKSFGIKRPEGVGRNDPLLRLGFGLGTLVVGSDEQMEQVPCRLVFPSRPLLGSLPAVAPSEGRGKPDNAIYEYLSGYQHAFEAISMADGSVVRIPFGDIRDPHFFSRNRSALSVLDMRDISIKSGGEIDYDWEWDDSTRATFAEMFSRGAGMLMIEFMGRVARELREVCGFEIDMELALARLKDERMAAGLVQLRPFGIAGEEGQITLSEVEDGKIIARAPDCIGHGRKELGWVVIVRPEAAENAGTLAAAQAAIADLNQRYGGEYLIIGPNITAEAGKAGVYAYLFNPGAIVSFRDSSVSMAHQLNHTFNNIAMMSVIECARGDAESAIARIMDGRTRKIVDGVYLARGNFVVEIDGTSGLGQAFVT